MAATSNMGDSRQKELNLAARKRFMNEFEFIHIDVAGQEEWMQDGKIFSVVWEDKEYFPSFQFDKDGNPYEEIGIVMDLLGTTGWGMALWMASNNAWLKNSERPVDALNDYPKAIVRAARQHKESMESF